MLHSLRPHPSDALSVAADREDVPASAFRSADALIIHAANLGGPHVRSPYRDCVRTSDRYAWRLPKQVSNGTVRFPAPARSLITLTTVRE
jgi:hypothetical protein